MNNGGDVLPGTVLSWAEQLPDEAHSFLSLHLPPGEKSAISPSTIPPSPPPLLLLLPRPAGAAAILAETKHNAMNHRSVTQNIVQK